MTSTHDARARGCSPPTTRRRAVRGGVEYPSNAPLRMRGLFTVVLGACLATPATAHQEARARWFAGCQPGRGLRFRRRVLARRRGVESRGAADGGGPHDGGEGPSWAARRQRCPIAAGMRMTVAQKHTRRQRAWGQCVHTRVIIKHQARTLQKVRPLAQVAPVSEMASLRKCGQEMSMRSGRARARIQRAAIARSSVAPGEHSILGSRLSWQLIWQPMGHGAQ